MTPNLLSATNGTTKKGRANGYAGKPVTETLTNGFFTVDQKWTVKYWNRAAEKILGVQAKDIVGKNLWEKFAGIIPVEFYGVYYKAFLKDIPVHFEEYWGEMGAWFDVITYYCEDTLSVSFKSSNHPHFEYPEDPLQRLKTLTELYRYVTEITNDCLWEWDLQSGEMFWIDGGHKRIFGYQIENALIPQSFWESRIHPDDKFRVLTKLNKIIEAGSDSIWEDEYRFKRADGEYAYVHDRGHLIYDRNKPSRMIGATKDITEKVIMEQQLEEERQTRQREITNAVLIAQENERREIGKELHDNLNQVLAVAKLYIEMAKGNDENRDMYLKTSSDFVEDVIVEVRKISKTLVLPATHIIGLGDNIKNLLRDLRKTHPVKIGFLEDDIDETALDEKFQLTVFRIVQEQINNILKHSGATHARIYLSGQADKITLLISDDGEGCDMSQKINGIGIINIKSRADLYHGTVTITSKPGKGYELKVILPLPGLKPADRSSTPE